MSTRRAVLLRFALAVVGTTAALAGLLGLKPHREPGTSALPPPVTRATAPQSTSTSDTPRTVTGKVVHTPYGPVQVSLVVKGSTITKATVLKSPDGADRSKRIAARAVPVLERETLDAQSATIHAVSGASYTSEGYMSSLQSALDRVL